MYALILIACTVVAVAIHFGLIRPVMHAIERQREESRRRAALEAIFCRCGALAGV